MDCQDCLRLLSNHLDGNLSRKLMEEMNEHLAECRSCRSELLVLRKIDYALTTQQTTRAPAGFTERLMPRLPGMEGVAGVAIPGRNLRLGGWGALIAATAALLLHLTTTLPTVAHQFSVALTELVERAIQTIFSVLEALSSLPYPSISPPLLIIVNSTICALFLAWSLWLTSRAVMALRE